MKGNKMTSKYHFFVFSLLFMLISCEENDPLPVSAERTFKMGFTTWSYGPTLKDVNNTYAFIENNADIYAEHIDSKIPWNAWINDLELPFEFTTEIAGRVNRKIAGNDLLLSVSLLNSNRDDLAEDFDGTVPSFSDLSAVQIEDAYFKHITYLVNQFSPDYLVIAIEVNELRLRNEAFWESYQQVMQNVKTRVKAVQPNLLISESITLHNLIEPDTTNPTAYIDEMITYANQMDFVAISFYPFFNGLSSKDQFQSALDLLHDNLTKPIAIVETSHIAEDLIVPNLNLSIPGSEAEQNLYLETLLENAQAQDYMFTIWWAYRDYDVLWETFPPELQDLGQLWRDTGLINENTQERTAKGTWDAFLMD